MLKIATPPPPPPPPGETLPITFAPLVKACAAHGIGKTTAYELADAGLLDTFLIGRRRFVTLASLAALPDRIGPDGKPR